MPNSEALEILGLSLNGFARKTVFLRCEEWLKSTTSHQIVTVNPEFVVEAQRNSAFRDCINGADLSLIDGFGLLHALKIRYPEQRIERLTGVELTLELACMATRLEKSLYLVGGVAGVAQQAAQKLQEQNPGLRIAGADEGPPLGCTYTEWEVQNQALLKRIHNAKPDIIFVAFGAPKQDLWIKTYLSQMPLLKIAVGVGGTFDYIAGTVSFAPAWMRACGIEWLFRLYTQPRRMRRIFTAVIVFPLLVARDTLFKSKPKT